MWKDLRKAFIVATALMLAGCNSDNGFDVGQGGGAIGGGDDEPLAVVAASLTLLASSPQLGSSGSSNVVITAIVRDANNNLIGDIPVAFSANSGALEVTQNVTGGGGQALALLTTGGDQTNRPITVRAFSGNLEENVSVTVTGTTLSINGEGSAALNDSVALTITLRDSATNPIANRTVSVSSALGNTLSSPTLTTNANGQVQLTLIVSNPGTDTITVSAQGASATHTVEVSSDEFFITAPALDAVIPINTCVAVTANWQQAGAPVNGEVVNFSTTRGTLYANDVCNIAVTPAVTNGAGTAGVYVRSNNAGPATLRASVAGGPTTSRVVNFVATTAASLNLQASPSTIGPNNGSEVVPQQSTIIATVRDADNNLVANKVVNFSLVQDNSGGQLLSPTATTNFQGQASTTYVSSSSTTARDGVQIRAEVVEGASTIANTVNLTVAQSPLFIRLGTGNIINDLNDTQYGKPYTAIVTDASGNAAVGVRLNLAVNPVDSTLPSNPRAYAKGRYEWNGDVWFIPGYLGAPLSTIDPDHNRAECVNEDQNMNGILDLSLGEDNNGDGRLTPGNVASVPTSVTTGPDGTFQFLITYPKQFAQWVQVRLSASTTVDGTESIDVQDFWLPVAAAALTNEDIAPPGATSPFGIGPCP